MNKIHTNKTDKYKGMDRWMSTWMDWPDVWLYSGTDKTGDCLHFSKVRHTSDGQKATVAKYIIWGEDDYIDQVGLVSYKRMVAAVQVLYTAVGDIWLVI